MRVSSDGKCAFADTTGKIVIAPGANCAEPVLGISGFSDGFARVERKGKKGFINKAGKLVIPATYDDAGYFSEGLASVSKRDKWGYINKAGKNVTDFIFEAAWPFHEGKAKVKKAGLTGMINKEGKVVLPLNYEEIIQINDFYVATLKGRKLLMNNNLKVILPAEYDDIRKTRYPEILQLLKAGKMAYYHVDTGNIFWKEDGF
jgi:hypothetical protein